MPATHAGSFANTLPETAQIFSLLTDQHPHFGAYTYEISS
jgi:hypothetical protein